MGGAAHYDAWGCLFSGGRDEKPTPVERRSTGVCFQVCPQSPPSKTLLLPLLGNSCSTMDMVPV